MDSPCRTILGETVAKPFRAEITASTSVKRPKLVGILATDSAPSKAYAQWTAKACADVGIEYELRELERQADGKAAQEEVEGAILRANEEDETNGIMVYYPIFGAQQDGYLQQAVNPLKDVEGLNFTWLFSLYHNIRFVSPVKLAFGHASLTSLGSSTSSTPAPSEQPEPGLVKALLPCTPLALVKALEHFQVYNTFLPYGSRLYGKTITVINRSEIVGRPLSALLSNDGSRVFSVDVTGVQEFNRRSQESTAEGKNKFLPRHTVIPTTKTLEECLAISDVVISGVPSKDFKVPSAALKAGVVALNFSESKNFEDDIKSKASVYCPGIGKVTIAMLQRNLVRLGEYQQIVRDSKKQEAAA